MNWLTLGIIVVTLCGCADSSGPDTAATKSSTATSVNASMPQRQSIDHVLTALGSIESIHHPTISAETSGQIISIEVYEGETVQAGQLMGQIDNTLHKIEADKATAELQRQEVLLENQQREVNRLLQLARSQSVSRDRLEDEQAQLAMLTALRDVAKKQRQRALHLDSKTRILAAQTGIIARRHVSIGDYVTPGQALFKLIAVDTLRARIAFPEHQAASIAIGKQVSLNTPTAQKTVAVGTVTSINPQINPRSRAIDVIVEFDNPGNWHPGASVDATMIVKQSQDALTIPTLAVVRRAGHSVVFVIDGNRASQRTVELGWREGDRVEVVHGLAADDLVVTDGSAQITDGSVLILRDKTPTP